jgi:hypothetical protein
MTRRVHNPAIADEAPTSTALTRYDKGRLIAYTRLLLIGWKHLL